MQNFRISQVSIHDNLKKLTDILKRNGKTIKILKYRDFFYKNMELTVIPEFF